MPVTIVRATEKDAAALAAIAAVTFPLACPPDAKPEAIQDFISKNLTETSFDGYLADPNRALYLAIEDDVAIGYAMAVFGEPTDPDVVAAITIRPTSELSKLYVAPGHHGAGVSTSLVDAVVAEASARGAAGMWLGVNQFNPRANRFYEKSGFEQVGIKKFLVGERWEDDFVRERAL